MIRSTWTRNLIFVVTFLLAFDVSHASTKIKNGSKPATPDGKSIPVTENDVRILHRASEILANSSTWNQKDNRKCPTNARTFSLYCALFIASIDINGEFDHRAGALEELRRTIDDYSRGKDYEHRLMGFNNDPSTKFYDIKKILRETELKVSQRVLR